MEKRKDLLFEIGTEELPASFIPLALSTIGGVLQKSLNEERLEFSGFTTMGTPRRLVFIVSGLPVKQPDGVFEARGPRKSVCYDEAGKPTKVLEGFCRGQGVAPRDIKTVKTEKGEYVSAVKHVKGEKTEKLLRKVLEHAITREVFPKSMRWGHHETPFARPVHWILAIFDGKKVNVNFGHIGSSANTYGHRFLPSGRRRRPLKVDSVESYMERLKENFVIVDPGERKRIIKAELEREAGKAGGAVLPDEALLEEVTYLVEYPVVVTGSFEREFLSLPREVIINSMREHQRYFSVVDRGGALLPFFLTVSNTKAEDMGAVKAGNERVLRARLNDAKFYYEKDVKIPLSDRVEDLKGVIFQSKLGTSYEKVERFAALAIFIGSKEDYCDAMDADEKSGDFLRPENDPRNYPQNTPRHNKAVLARAALLSKADLVSGVVGEFPTLQGKMGRIYAEKSGEIPAVAEAIADHYLPVASGGELPSTTPGAIISVADKLDTVCGCFGVGLIPTGDQDPYGLRRQALGIIAIMLEKGFAVPLDELIGKAVSLLSAKLTRPREEVARDVADFFKERLKFQLLAQNFSFDSVDAVLSSRWQALPDALKRIKAIEDFKAHPNYGDLITAFKRVSNILKGRELGERAPDSALFQTPEEQGLFKAAGDITPRVSASLERGDYPAVFDALVSIKDRIDSFFDKVMVMVEDPAQRENRLLLLNTVKNLYARVGDLSRLMV